MLKRPDRTYLVVLQTNGLSHFSYEENLFEMRELAVSAASHVVGQSCARVDRPSPSHYLRQGKLSEIMQKAMDVKANRLCFNVDLSPGQARNIEKTTKIQPIDRTGLILEIFARRAKSKEGKLQVELARLNYILPRLGGLGQVMSRLGGGIGTRGPGEQELEWDRRKIRRRIQRVKEELVRVSKHRQLLRSNRKKKNYTAVALVGYTNAGKSTLLNALTDADAYVEDKLFATLDPKTRIQKVNSHQEILFIDTVGFIRDLPHGLVEAFHATLEEVAQADALIHVMDASNANLRDHKKAVDLVLGEIKAAGKPMLIVLNKVDLINDQQRHYLETLWPQAVLISAKQRLGLQGLLLALEGLVKGCQSHGV